MMQYLCLSRIFLCAFIAFSFLFTPTAFGQSKKVEYGKCGYYSDALQGRKTSSGEKYDKNAYTCAHKSLPYGTRVRVTRMDNKKSVLVRVNDRGPYIEGYVVDVSRKAANAIGLIRDGVTRVKVEVVEAVDEANLASSSRDDDEELLELNQHTRLLGRQQDDEESPAQYGPTIKNKKVSASRRTALRPGEEAAGPELYGITITSPDREGFAIQAASLADTENMFAEAAKLQRYYPDLVLFSFDPLAKVPYKLLVGPFQTRSAADRRVREVTAKGYKGAFVIDLSEQP